MSVLHLAEVFTSGYDQYCVSYGSSNGYHKVVRAITSCRTEVLGGHVYQCPDCHAQLSLYNSCGNRHCPQCQTLARHDWVDARKSELLPVPYFHSVFTIPSELNPFALRNKKAFYAIMFRSVNETMQQLAATSKYLGASIGFIAVLHTWGQNLMDHPHIHCIVPAGGISRNGKLWIGCKGFYLFPFSVMKMLFRAKVLDYFKRGLADGSITLCGNLAEYQDPARMRALINSLYKKKWVVFAKQPFAGPERVIEYLGNYTHRVAITESRLKAFESSTVTFTYKDYADNGREKIMTLKTVEFIRRFLLHVLPKGFMRIRHYGFFSNSIREKGLKQCANIFASVRRKQNARKEKKKPQPWHTRVKERTGIDPLVCKKCGKAVMMLIARIDPVTTVGKVVCSNSP
jgi:hypothetical protein